jgi:asparagine synthase (glutamine-hydrolysing)
VSPPREADRSRLQKVLAVGSHPFVGYWGRRCDFRDAQVTALAQGARSTLYDQWVQPQTTAALAQDWGWNVVYFAHTIALRQALVESRQQIDDRGLPQDAITLAAASASGVLPRGTTDLGRSDLWVEVADWGQESPQLILGREPFGRVPLYYYPDQDTSGCQRIWFASHLDLLLPLLLSNPALSNPAVNPAALYGYSCFSYVPTPLTPIVGIQSVPAGESLRWEIRGGLQSLPPEPGLDWGSPEPIAARLSQEEAAIAQLQDLLRGAIAAQIADLPIDQPIGVFLSGGLDSMVVAALLVQAGIRVRAYTLDFGPLGVSEVPYAEQVAAALGIPLVKVDASPCRIKAALVPTVRALGMPIGDGVTVPLYLLGQAAARDVRVVFNGEGGDQLFAGWTNKPLVAAGIYAGYGHQSGDRGTDRDDLTQAYLQTFHRLWGYEDRVFVPEVAAQMRDYDSADWITAALTVDRPGEGLLDRLRRANLMLKGAQNIHPRATALAAVHGLQVRSPFCDLPLAQWLFGLSSELILQGACEKYILKRAIAAMVPTLPTELIWRTKRGMGVPLTAWCNGPFWGELGTWLNPGRLRAEGLWQADLAATIVAGQLSAGIQGRRIGETLWLIIMWELWREHCLDPHLGHEFGEATRSWDHPFWRPRWLWSVQQWAREDA